MKDILSISFSTDDAQASSYLCYDIKKNSDLKIPDKEVVAAHICLTENIKDKECLIRNTKTYIYFLGYEEDAIDVLRHQDKYKLLNPIKFVAECAKYDGKMLVYKTKDNHLKVTPASPLIKAFDNSSDLIDEVINFTNNFITKQSGKTYCKM